MRALGAAVFGILACAGCADVWGFGDLVQSDGGSDATLAGDSNAIDAHGTGGDDGMAMNTDADGNTDGGSSPDTGSGADASGGTLAACASGSGCTSYAGASYCPAQQAQGAYCCGTTCATGHMDNLSGHAIYDCTPENSCTEAEAMCLCNLSGNVMPGACETTTFPGAAVCGRNATDSFCTCWGFGTAGLCTEWSGQPPCQMPVTAEWF